MDTGLKGKTAMVLASSKGLGKASTLQFAKEGANVTLASRSQEQLELAASEIEKETGHRPLIQVIDVTKADDLKLLSIRLLIRMEQ